MLEHVKDASKTYQRFLHGELTVFQHGELTIFQHDTRCHINYSCKVWINSTLKKSDVLWLAELKSIHH